MTDFALLDRWFETRDAEAFSELAARHAGMVYATCRRILGNPTDAEEVAQECFEVLASVPARKRPTQHLGAWLHTVATNRAFNRLKSDHSRKFREAAFAGQQDNPTVQWSDIYEHVDAALASLPDKFRIPLIAHFLENKSHAEIAAALGVSRQTVGYRIEQGIQRLRNALRKRGVAGVTATTLATMLIDNSAQAAPAALAAQIGKIALAGAAAMPEATGASSVAGMIGGVLVMKKTMIVLGFVLVVLIGSWLVGSDYTTSSPEFSAMIKEKLKETAIVPTVDMETPSSEEGVVSPASNQAQQLLPSRLNSLPAPELLAKRFPPTAGFKDKALIKFSEVEMAIQSITGGVPPERERWVRTWISINKGELPKAKQCLEEILALESDLSSCKRYCSIYAWLADDPETSAKMLEIVCQENEPEFLSDAVLLCHFTRSEALTWHYFERYCTACPDTEKDLNGFISDWEKSHQ